MTLPSATSKRSTLVDQVSHSGSPLYNFVMVWQIMSVAFLAGGNERQA
jgi:hypothetical protein